MLFFLFEMVWAVACAVVFDERHGPRLGWVEPTGDFDETLRRVLETDVPYLSLPENTSSIEERRDVEAVLFKVGGLFGASVMRSERAQTGKRKARQEAVVVACGFPCFDLLETRAKALAVVALEGRPDPQLLRDVVQGVARRACEPSSFGDYAATLGARELVVKLGAEKLARLARVVLAAGRLVFFSEDLAFASRSVLALASLFPALVSLGLSDSVTTDSAPLLGANSFRWTKHGFPLRTGTEWAPAVAMATAERFFGQGSFVVGTCNAMLARRLLRAVVVDLDNGSVSGDKLFSATLDKETARFAKDVAKQTAQEGEWVGSDQWLRARAELWLTRLLANPPSPRKSVWSRQFASCGTVTAWRGSVVDKIDDKDERDLVEGAYVGDLDDAGRRHGVGRLSFPDGGCYEGEFRAGTRCGQGAYTSPKMQYDGSWLDDMEHGVGVQVFEHRTSYEGEFCRGQFHGFGELKAPGFVYKGEFSEGMFCGAGSLEGSKHVLRPAKADNSFVKHVGEWRRGLRCGVGHSVLADGTVLSGTWKADQLVEGTISSSRGQETGTFVDGKLHGEGSWTCPDGDLYEGPFDKGDMKEGTWTVKYKDGSKYAGEVSDGVPNGTGVMRYANGDVFSGQYVDGLRSGKGTLVSGGQTLTGDWRCDTFVEPPPVEDNFFVGRDDVVVDWTESVEGDAKDDPSDTPLVATEPSRDDEVSKAPRNGTARVRYPNGDTFEGGYKRGLREGQGIFTEALTGHVYDGQWVKGRRHGHGTFTTGDGRFVYDGRYENGARTGFGVAKLKDACNYSGEWLDNLFHGHGQLIDASRNSYEGEFANGRKHGIGSQSYADGSVYKGEFARGRRSGHGHCDNVDGTTYTGVWLRDKPHGHGTVVERRTGESLFDGVFERGLKHGWGIQTASDGTTREGYWARGDPVLDAVSEWTLVAPDGACYVGPLTADFLPHGKHGVYKAANGDTYSGGYVNGKRAGFGTAIYHNGDHYAGEWHDGHVAFNGQGQLTLANGHKHLFDYKEKA